MALLGVRCLREDFLKPSSKGQVPSNMKEIEARLLLQPEGHRPEVSAERTDLPRFKHFFEGGELFPPGIFVLALELPAVVKLNGRQFTFDSEVLTLRDTLVVSYKPVVAKIRALRSKEIQELPLGPVIAFARAWTAWESAWLRNCEVHAVDSLQPLAKAIISLEPLLLSVEKERLLPWPRVQHQKAVTLKCLEGFISAFNELAATVLPSVRRELDHDARLLLLMEHVLSLKGVSNVQTCLDGVSAAPDVAFPDLQHKPIAAASDPKDMVEGSRPGAKGLTLNAYAFRLLGTSVGDAAAAGRLKMDTGVGFAGRAKLLQSPGGVQVSTARRSLAAQLGGEPQESELASKAVSHAAELLTAFEGVKDLLLSLKSTLEYIDPALDEDEAFCSVLLRFEKAFRRSKRLFLEPENLA